MKIKLLKYDSYIQMIKNSVGTKMFRNLYLEIDNKKIDSAENGNLSCAFFVSNVLFIWGLVSEGHGTVKSTVKDMEKSGWKKISEKDIKPGDVIVWDKNEAGHYHNGFYIGNGKAVSNSSNGKRTPTVHVWDYNGEKKVVAIYTWPGFRK